jgi:hypothetical protein
MDVAAKLIGRGEAESQVDPNDGSPDIGEEFLTG